jgi:hypothetical protein
MCSVPEYFTQSASKPRRVSVDAALALDEVVQRFTEVLVFRCVPQHA